MVNISIDHFSSYSFNKLTRLVLYDLDKVDDITGNNLPNLTLLDIRNLSLITKINTTFPSLKSFLLYNSIDYTEDYDWQYYPVLENLAILNTSIVNAYLGASTQHVVIGNHYKLCNLSNVTWEDDSKLLTFMAINTKLGSVTNLTLDDLKTLFLNYNMNLTDFSNNTLPDLQLLNLCKYVII